MSKTRFLMIGGFLGAGKTTAIARLAKHYTDLGLTVGIVTNDQAYGLVDTETLRAQGFDVGEVPGACFCCKFNDLVDTIATLGADQHPDIILTEPVGSCTDLVATVLRPMQHLFGDRYELAPLAVLCKPEHGKKILAGGSGGFSPQAAYIFLKQLEEAPLIVLNKVDKLTRAEREDLLNLLRDRFANSEVLATSSQSGEGFDELIEALAGDYCSDQAPLEIDYDTYAQGEAALGWLNCGVTLSAEQAWALDEIAQQLVAQFAETLLTADMEPGHVKVLASADQATAIANWVESETPVELSVSSNAQVNSTNLLVNVRVHGDPNQVAELVKAAITKLAEDQGLACELADVQYFRPGRPEPTHRYDSATG